MNTLNEAGQLNPAREIGLDSATGTRRINARPVAFSELKKVHSWPEDRAFIRNPGIGL
jgi:hypothetical protein